MWILGKNTEVHSFTEKIQNVSFSPLCRSVKLNFCIALGYDILSEGRIQVNLICCNTKITPKDDYSIQKKTRSKRVKSYQQLQSKDLVVG